MRIALLALTLALAACEKERPEAPSAAENSQLDEAGRMLDEMGDEPAPTASNGAEANAA